MSNYYICPSDDYVSHHGVLGQRWGVRRYQNKDGTLTALGKRLQNQYDENRKSKAYRVGYKRLSNRINKNDVKYSKSGKDKYKQMADTSASMISAPDVVKKFGKETLRSRRMAKVIAAASVIVANSWLGPVFAIPVDAIAVGGVISNSVKTRR